MKKLFNKIQINTDNELPTYLWFLFLCVLCYGLLIPYLGFYWDDLPYLYQYQIFGPAGFSEFVASDRPFSAWIFAATTWLFGFNPIGYHILAFILRFSSGLLFYQIIKTMLPQKREIRIISTAVFLIYPGFLQQPIALIYNHHLSVLCLFLLSVLLMLINAKRDNPNMALTILSSAFTLGIFSIENFAMLELIRPVLLWIILKKKYSCKQNLWKTLFLQYAPYFFLLSFFLFWRIFIFKFPTYKPSFVEEFLSTPIAPYKELLIRILGDFATVTWAAWTRPFKMPTISQFGTIATYLIWAITLISIFGSFFFLAIIEKGDGNHKSRSDKILWLLLIALLLFLMAGSIIWVLDLPLEIEFAWDRMTLAFIPSVSLFIASIYYLIRHIKPLKLLFISLLIGMAVEIHFQNGVSYKRDWERLNNFFWQLTWRAPDLAKNTTLLSSQVGLTYYSDNSLTAPLNLTYSPDKKSREMDYLFYFTTVRLGSKLDTLEKGQEINQLYRSFYFSGNTTQTIAYKFDPPGCLQLLDSRLSNSITNPNLSQLQVDEMRLTNLDLITASPQHNPFEAIFGPEPDHDWCFYFLQADLARQKKQFNRVVELGDTAIQAEFAPRIASEWLPFIEGYIWNAEWDKVRTLADKIVESEGNYHDGLCYTFLRIMNDDNFSHKKELQEFIWVYNCQW